MNDKTYSKTSHTEYSISCISERITEDFPGVQVLWQHHFPRDLGDWPETQENCFFMPVPIMLLGILFIKCSLTVIQTKNFRIANYMIIFQKFAIVASLLG